MSASYAPSETAASAALSPVQRLEASRERLREAMASVGRRAGATHGASDGVAASWLDSLKSLPGLGPVIDSLQGWWSRHPLRAAIVVAQEAAGAALGPFARRHPFALIASTMLIGAFLARARSWRGVTSSALFAGMLPRMMTRFVSSLPIDAWLEVLLSVIGRPVRPAAGDSSARATRAADTPMSVQPIDSRSASTA